VMSSINARILYNETFSIFELIMAMAPLPLVMDRIRRDDLSPTDMANLLTSLFDDMDVNKFDIRPSPRYIKSILLQFLKINDNEKECNDELASLLSEVMCHNTGGKSGGRFGSSIADPEEIAHVSYKWETSEEVKKSLIFKIYPYHNDVGVRKIWEAGACLAEYLMEYPSHVAGKNVVELGAGIGLTGMVAYLKGANSVHLSDYTDACLYNLHYNIKINSSLLSDYKRTQASITSGYLDWCECSKNMSDCSSVDLKSQTSLDALANADVVLAADVVYDREVIPGLVKVVKYIMSTSKKVYAIIATTFRNEVTFELFEKELKKHNCTFSYVDPLIISSLPVVFPCYFTQGRDEVRISLLTNDKC